MEGCPRFFLLLSGSAWMFSRPPAGVMARKVQRGVHLSGLWALPREGLVVAHGLYHVENGGARSRGVVPVVQQRRVGRPFDHAVGALGGEGGKLVLQLEPGGGLLAGADDGERFVARDVGGARLGRGLGGGAELIGGCAHLPRRGIERLDLS